MYFTFVAEIHRQQYNEGKPLIDPSGSETTTEYYIVRIYRRSPGKDGEPATLVGIIEDTEGHCEPFRNNEDLLKALTGKLGQNPARGGNSNA
ncbi:hypothetical protein [Methylosarcina fibrata]|uniref:hypothetical protein n=1 Tax=Methylosarcina fibrata TaxID=105972 RepID=UPI00036937A7|nr:hypothetical protein [Methylosarcina fibrata]